MQDFYNDAFEKEIDEYLASLDPLDEETMVAYEAAADIEIEAAWLKELERRHG